MLATLVRYERIGVLMCETVCRTPNNTVKNQLISLLLKQRSSASFFLKISAETWQIFTLHSLKSFASCLFTLCTITKSRNSCFFCTTLCTCSPGDSITGYETLGSPLMTQERSLRSDVTATSRTNSFNETASLRARARASYTLRSALRSSRTRVIWFGKRTSPELLLIYAERIAVR